MGNLANNEDPDVMQQNAAFHRGLHFLLRQNRSPDKACNIFFEKIITCDPSIYIAVSNIMRNSFGTKKG